MEQHSGKLRGPISLRRRNSRRPLIVVPLESPILHALAKVRWQFFATFTFKQERMPEVRRVSMFFATLRRLTAQSKSYFPAVPWVLRQESGEALGRLHYHALIGGLPEHFTVPVTTFFLADCWKRIGGGHAKVSIFDRSLNGPEYVLKCLSGQPDRLAADSYESAKFGSPRSHVILSRSLWRVASAGSVVTDTTV